MKGFIELTDSLGNRCMFKTGMIAKVCERKHYRIYELDDHPKLGTKDENKEWQDIKETTYIEGGFPCRDLYVREPYEEVLRMMADAME